LFLSVFQNGRTLLPPNGHVTKGNLSASGHEQRIAELEAEVAELRRKLERIREQPLDSEQQHNEAAAAGMGRMPALDASNHAPFRADADQPNLGSAQRAVHKTPQATKVTLEADRDEHRHSDELLRIALDSASDFAIFTLSPDRRVTSWNLGASLLLGWKAEEILGRSGDLIFTAEDLAAGVPQQEADRARQNGRAANERWHLRKDGSRFWASGMAMPLRAPASPGAPLLGFVKIMRDATERQRTEAQLLALVELGDRLRSLDAGLDFTAAAREIAGAAAEIMGQALGAIRAGYASLDPVYGTFHIEREWRSGQFQDVREAYRFSECWTHFMEDLSREQLVVIEDTRTDPRTSARAESLAEEAVLACLNAPVLYGGRVVGNLYIHSPEPRRWSTEEKEFVRGVAGRVWSAIARYRAVAALHESERRLKATQDHAGVGIHEVDTEGHYLRPNETFIRMTGYTEEDLKGRLVWDTLAGEDVQEKARENFAQLVRGEVEQIAEERRFITKQGHPWWAEVRTTAIREAPKADHPNGRFLHAVRVVHDITERKKAEERRDLLIMELNHRVKNTLAVVQSLAMQTAREAADSRSFIATYQARLFALSKAHDLLTKTEWQGAPLVEVVHSALEASGGIEISSCASKAVLSPGEALSLALAFHELTTNAVKYGALSTPEGRVKVWCDRDGDLEVIHWVERGGPRVPGPPQRKGLGLRLLERGLSSASWLTPEMRFEPEGFSCTFRLQPGRQGCVGRRAHEI
jgi:PAS domain S-box-containing protein